MDAKQPATCAGSYLKPRAPRPMELRRNRVDRGLFWGCRLCPQCREAMPYRPDLQWIPAKKEPPQEELRSPNQNQADTILGDGEIPYLMRRGEALIKFQKATQTGAGMGSVSVRLVGSVSPQDGRELVRRIRTWRP